MKLFVLALLVLLDFQFISAKLHTVSSISKSHLGNHGKAKKFLLVSSTPSEPFMYQNESGKIYDGIEYKLIETIAKKEKLKLFIQNQPNPLKLDQLKPEKLNYDIFVGGLFPNATFFDHLEPSKPYYQDDMMWCVKKAAQVHFLLHIFLAATPEIWLTLIFGIGYTTGFLLYLMIQFDLEYKKRNQRDWHYTTWLIALPAVIGVSPRFYPKSASLRAFYCFILVTSMFEWQIYLFLGVKFLKVHVPKHQISTKAEIVDWEYRLSGSNEVFGLISSDDRYKKSQIDAFFICPSIDDCLDHLKHDDNDYLAVGGSRQRILNSRSYSPSSIFCFDRTESIASYQPALLTPQDLNLKRKIDKIILNAFESGLIAKWDRDNQRKKKHLPSHIPQLAYTMNEFGFAFVLVLGIGSLMAASSLLCEIIISHKMKQTPTRKIWSYLEQFFDGDRHYLKDLPEKLMRK